MDELLDEAEPERVPDEAEEEDEEDELDESELDEEDDLEVARRPRRPDAVLSSATELPPPAPAAPLREGPDLPGGVRDRPRRAGLRSARVAVGGPREIEKQMGKDC